MVIFWGGFSGLKGKPLLLKGDAKLHSVNGFSLLPILNPDIPHGGVKTLMTGEVSTILTVFEEDGQELLRG